MSYHRSSQSTNPLTLADNVKAAKVLGIELPRTLLAQADAAVE
jgi:hypothetical protein